jgi:hypothetical protein
VTSTRPGPVLVRTRACRVSLNAERYNGIVEVSF